MVESIRIEAACRALEASELPLKAIADQVGYGDEQAMRRAFQRQFSVGPKVYRERFSSGATTATDGAASFASDFAAQ